MITLPQRYEQDIQSKVQNINQLIRIGSVLVARTKVYLRDVDDGTLFFYEDRDLKISSIKQSVDFNSRAFKISSVSVSVSNYKIDGNRFSDLFISQSLINKPASIYYMTKGATSLEDCIKVFEGKIRRFNITERKASLSLEDVSQEKLHKDLPVSRLPDAERILEEYRNKIIPMVFGYNDKSPLVYYRENILDNQFYWIPDNVFHSEGDMSLGGKAGEIAGFEGNIATTPGAGSAGASGALDIISHEQPVRAWKDDWVEVPIERNTFKTDTSQYEIINNQYIQMEKDTASLEELQIMAVQTDISSDELLLSTYLQLSPITNNVFEGIVYRKAANCILHDVKIPSDENDLFDYDIHYKGATGAGTNELGGGGGGNRGAGTCTGGNGIVLIRRATSASGTTSGTVSTDGADTIHKFTADGTYIG